MLCEGDCHCGKYWRETVEKRTDFGSQFHRFWPMIAWPYYCGPQQKRCGGAQQLTWQPGKHGEVENAARYSFTALLPPGSSHQAPPSDRQLSRRLCFLTSSLPNNPIKEKRALKIKALLQNPALNPSTLGTRTSRRLFCLLRFINES